MKEKKTNFFKYVKISKPTAVGIITFVAVFFFCILFFLSRDLKGAGLGTGEKPVEITIPANYYTYIGSSADEAVKTYTKMGEDYCLKAKNVNGDVLLRVTKEQRENLIKQNNEKIEMMLASYYKEDSRYKFESGDALVYRYDEKCDTMVEQKAIVGVISLYGLNYILENNKTDWKVNVEVYNCHNDKLIQKATAPNDVVMVKYDQWLESYKKEAE